MKPPTPTSPWLSRLLHWLAVRTRRLVGRLWSARRVPEPALLTGPTLALPLRACATVVIPALNEERRIAEVVAYALADPATAEVIVIDDSSVDATAERARAAGARVFTSSMLGKGASMRDGIAPAGQALLVYMDGDLTGLRSAIVSDLCAPLLRDEADFVKARFGRGGGRVTELTAKPMLKVFFPELAGFGQPLGGIIAARKSLLQTLSFENGYGVDVGLLIDAYRAGARLAEVDIGSLEHESQPLGDLTLMANEIGRVIFDRARSAGRLHVEQVAAMFESQRQAAAGIDYVLMRRKSRQRLLLLDMDGTVTPDRYVQALSRAAGNEAQLAPWLDGHNDADTRSLNIARLFQYLHKRRFEQVAQELELRPGVIDFVREMKRRGFFVGVVSDSYFVGAEIVRRRIFADFAMAHTITFQNEVCTGELRINPAFLGDRPAADTLCKSHVLRRFLADKNPPAVTLTWAVGDNLNDLALLKQCDQAFAIDPKAPELTTDPSIQVIRSFEELLARLPDVEPATAAVAPEPS